MAVSVNPALYSSYALSIISFQSPLYQDIWKLDRPTLERSVLAGYGATLIAVSSLFNGCGRILWGALSERLGRINSFRLLLASQLVVFGVLMTERNPWFFGALVCYVLSCFGGGFAIHALAGARRVRTQAHGPGLASS